MGRSPSEFHPNGHLANGNRWFRDDFAAVLVAGVNESGWQTMAHGIGQGL